MFPKMFFTYGGFEWIQPWENNGMVIHFMIMGILALFIMLGFLYRISAFLFFLSFTFIFLIDQTNYLNHFYLICLISFLLILIPAHRNYSIDAALRPHIKADTIPIWALWILLFQIGVAYFYGGVAKINPDWLQGEPMGIWLSKRAHLPYIGQYFRDQGVVIFMSRAGLLLDLFIVPFLLYKPTRVVAYIVVLSFHVMNVFLWNIGIFPWFMIVATTLFFTPSWPKALLRKLSFTLPNYQSFGVLTKHNFSSRRWRKSLVILLILFCTWQMLFPLRHFAIPGDVNWTEEGHKFSWHMKLRDKKSEISIFAKDNDTNEEWEINILSFLNPRQANDMSTHPYLLWQFARKLKKHYQGQGHENVSITALVFSSLNGRVKQLYIDPNLDLASLEKYTTPAFWIYPLRTPLREGKNLNKIDFDSKIKNVEQ